MRRATPNDLPAIQALRLAVGWQAHDWALLDAMQVPHAAFFVLEEGGRLVAMGSGIAYGALGIVGNMAVADGERRRGHGTRILEAVTAFLRGRGVTRMELFATADGRLLYERHGFEPMRQSAMVRLSRGQAASAAREDAQLALRAATPQDLDLLTAYDRPRYGADRSPVLAHALADPDRPALLATRDGTLAGYAVLRPAGARIGPWVADDTHVAAALLAKMAATPEVTHELTTNLPGENTTGWAWLEEIGADLEPSDGRMGRGPDIPRRTDTVYGNTIGALG